MKTWAVMAAVVASSGALACGPDNGPYIALGIGAHPVGADRPENTLHNPLGVAKAGYQFGPWVFEYEHQSGLLDVEQGYGSNSASVQYVIRWRQ